MISALADAGAALGARGLPGRRGRLRARSSSASCVMPTAACCARSTAAGRSCPAFLEDHAYLLEAYLTLYESTFDARWFARAVELAETILERFLDPERGGFFSVSDDHTGLIARRKDLEDAPIPSGASAACFGLLRLARLTGEAPLRGRGAVADPAAAHRRPRAPAGVRPPAARDRLPPRPGPRGRAGGRRRRVAGARSSAAASSRTSSWRAATGDVPLLAGRGPVDGQAAAYVCERFTCQLPVTSAEELAKSLQD